MEDATLNLVMCCPLVRRSWVAVCSVSDPDQYIMAIEEGLCPPSICLGGRILAALAVLARKRLNSAGLFGTNG